MCTCTVDSQVMYMISNMPRLVLNMAEYMLYPKVYDVDSCGCSLTPTWFAILCRISHLLLTVNSSLNFLIYFSIGKRFKRIVCQQIQKPAKKLEESLFYRKTSDSNSFNVNLSRKEEEFLLLIYSRKFETNRMSLSLNQIEIGLGNDINDRKRSISVDGESSLSKINE